jgi:Flp pilus assembly protein TadG
MSKLARGEDGNTLIELALMLPVLVMLLLGTFDFGHGFTTYIALANASREGARWLTTNPTDAPGARSRVVTEAARVGLSAADIVITITPNKSIYASGDQVSVKVSHNYRLLFGAVPGIPSVTFNVQSTMRVVYSS